MKVVVQRVLEAEVLVDGVSVGRIGRGLALLVGLAIGDDHADVEWMARKVVGLRVFDDGAAGGERSVVEIAGEVLAVSQFTLAADCSKGRRPSFDRAMPAAEAAPLFERFCHALARDVGAVETGRFGARMHVRTINDGPFTLVIDSPTTRTSTSMREPKL